MQAADDASIGGAVQLVERRSVLLLGEPLDRQHRAGAKALVDARDLGFDLLPKQCVGRHAAAGGRRHLQQAELADPLRVREQQMLQRLQPLQQALGVVEAINAEQQPGRRRQVVALAHVAPALLDRRQCKLLFGTGPANRDRVAAGTRRRVAQAEPVDRGAEVGAVQLGLQPDNRAAEQALHQFALPRADRQLVGVRPRDVPEADDGGARQPRADQSRQQRKVIVLHQHDRVVRAGLGQHRVGKALIDALVVLPVALAEHRPHMRQVTQRPQALVGKAITEALLLALTQPDPPQRVLGRAGRHRADVVVIDERGIGTAAAMRDPGAGAGAHQRIERGDQATRGPHHAHAGSVVFMDVGRAVRDHDHLLAGQLGAQHLAQALCVPRLAIRQIEPVRAGGHRHAG